MFNFFGGLAYVLFFVVALRVLLGGSGSGSGAPRHATAGVLHILLLRDLARARDWAVAEAIANGVARWRRDVVLLGLAGSPMLDAFRRAGFTVAAEAFADRRYEADGSLRSRKFTDALILDPAQSAAG